MTTPYLTPPVFSWPAAPGGKLHTYLAGGTVAQATYSDAAGVTPNTNPVTLDSNGSAVVRLAVGVAYHFVLKDSTDTTTLWDADNYDNAYLSSSTITASIIGAVLYPRTAAEIAAGVTPTNFSYPAGDARRFGFNGDAGGTDNTTALQNHFNGCAGSVTARIPNMGGYGKHTNVNIPANSTIFFENGAALQCNDASSAAMFTITGDNVLIYGQGSLNFNASMANSNIITGTSRNFLKIRDISLTGNQSINAVDTQHGNGIYLLTCNDVEIDNNVVTQCVQAGIRIQGANTGSARIKITRNNVTNITSTGGTYVANIHGITINDYVTDILIQSNRVDTIGTQANNTAGIGIAVMVLNIGFTPPSNFRILDNVVSNTCQHGLAIYASSLAQGVFDALSKVNNNSVFNTGLALLVGNGGIANSLGNGVYCEMLIVGTIVGNDTYNTHVNAISVTIADAAIACMVNTTSNILATTLTISGNRSAACNRAGLRLQRVAGCTITGHNATGCKTFGLQLDGVQDFDCAGSFLANAATGAGIALGSGGIGTLAAGVARGMLHVSTSGFTNSCTASFASNLGGLLRMSGYTTHGGYFPTSCTDVHIDIETTYESDFQCVRATGANTNCTVNVRGPNRTGSNTPYIYNSSTGLRCTFEADSVPNAAVMAFGIGDRALQRTPTASNPDYWRCVTGGVSGVYVWKAGANLAA